MWTISNRFREQLADGHTTTVRVEVLTDEISAPIDISAYFSSGSLDVSRQAIRRSGTITFEDHDGTITPKDPDGLLAPYGNQLRVWSGVIFPDGTEELVPVGTLRITKVRSRYPNVTVECFDRAWIVQGASLETPYQIAKGSDYDQAIRDLLLDRYPQASFDIPNVAEATPLLTFDADSDPWEHLQAMAQAVGYQLYFDPLGTCLMVPEQDFLAVEPVWTYDGKPLAKLPYDPADWTNLALYDQERELDTDQVFNVAVVTGESTSNTVPFRGIARDLDPTSPTVYAGKFGIRPAPPWSTPLAASQGMVDAAARARLQSQTGLAEALHIPAVPNPALECSDPIMVIRPELGVNTIHAIDHFTLPLRAEQQVIDTRVRRAVLGQ